MFTKNNELFRNYFSWVIQPIHIKRLCPSVRPFVGPFIKSLTHLYDKSWHQLHSYKSTHEDALWSFWIVFLSFKDAAWTKLKFLCKTIGNFDIRIQILTFSSLFGTGVKWTGWYTSCHWVHKCQNEGQFFIWFVNLRS